MQFVIDQRRKTVERLLVANRCSTVRGERIKVEPLSPQCQSITPPQ